MSNRELNAYRYPREIRPGCTHQLGCRCQPPYYLRGSSPAEREQEKRLQHVFSAEVIEELAGGDSQ